MLIKKKIALITCLFSFIPTQFISLKAMNSDLTKFCIDTFGQDNFKVIRNYAPGSVASKVSLVKFHKLPNVLSGSDSNKEFILKFFSSKLKSSFNNEKLALDRLKEEKEKHKNNCPCLGCKTLKRICFPIACVDDKKIDDNQNGISCVISNFAPTQNYSSLALNLWMSSSDKVLEAFKNLLLAKIEVIVYLFTRGILYIDPHSGNWQLVYQESENNGKKEINIKPTLIDFGSLLDISKMDLQECPALYLPFCPTVRCNPITNKILTHFIDCIMDDWNGIMPKNFQSDLQVMRKLKVAYDYFNNHTASNFGFNKVINFESPVNLLEFLHILISLHQWLFTKVNKDISEKELIGSLLDMSSVSSASSEKTS